MNHRLSAFTITTMTVLAAGACQSDEVDEQQELQALLRDAPLTLPGVAAAPASEAHVDAPGAIRDHFIPPTAAPIGAWDFEDCTPERTGLFDGSFNGNTAFRAVAVACTAGVHGGQALAIANPEDIVYVPDQPSFTFGAGVTVAGWFNPSSTGDTRTLFRKRDRGTSSFALVLHRSKFRFVVGLADGTAISVTAPTSAQLGVFQHVAGTYDDTTLRLYVDGVEVASATAPGVIQPGAGPLLMANDGSERRFDGAIDDMLFATHALTADEVQALTCFPQAPTVVVTPASATAPPGEPAAIDVAITNHNPAVCPPISVGVEPVNFDNRLIFDPPALSTIHSAPVPSGATGHVTVTATPDAAVAPGTIFGYAFDFSEPFSEFFTTAFFTVTVTQPTGCHVDNPRELLIKSTSVVDDPVRTAFDPSSSDPRSGVWTFKHLVENIAPTPADAPAMVEAMLDSFTTPQTINGFTVDARPGMQTLVLDRWPRTPDGALDLARAPLRLQAIVNRIDLRDLASGDAGEGRFVFAFNDGTLGFPLQATMTFEYKLPAASDQDVLDWARSFHALGALPFGEDYNAALQAITERFAGRNARPGHPNGSAIGSVHTNEIAFNNAFWQMRQFDLSPTSGRLEPAPLAQTPDRSFDRTATLASYITANQTAILADRHTVPAVFAGQPFQAGAVFNDTTTWFAPGVDPEARRHFALDTCNGCHSLAETRTFFLHITPRTPGTEAFLSGFLTGISVIDPVTGQERTYNDLARRNADLKAIVCADPTKLSTGLAPTLRTGIQRVH